MHTVQVQPTLEGDKPVCTHAIQCVTKWYVNHTDNAQGAAVEVLKQQAEWVFSVKRGLSVLADR